ncbi:MAG: GNAT family N-acetyltransferase [Gemmataceae bacterium]
MTDFVKFDPAWRPPTLHTERLMLRPYCEADAPLLFPLVSNPNTTRFTLWEHHKTLDDTRVFVRDYALGRYAEGVPEPLAICIKEQPIGSCGSFWASYPHRTMEIGYWLAEPYWGRGIIVEAVRELVRYSFDSLKPKRIQARVIEGNAASIRVLEKLGFRFEGTHRSAILRRGRHEDVHYFAKLMGE